jgi:hypothetical protein
MTRGGRRGKRSDGDGWAGSGPDGDEIDFTAMLVPADPMHQLIDLDPGDSTIDLAGVSFIDAAGLGCLVGFANQFANETRRSAWSARQIGCGACSTSSSWADC